MKEFTSEEIQAQFEKLPQEVQNAVTSTDVNDKIEAISQRYSLHIDQTGELVDEIGLVMMGLRGASHFIEDLCVRLTIDQPLAEKISSDVSNEIFTSIKKHLIEIQTRIDEETPADQVVGTQNFQPITQSSADQSAISALETAGDFTIEPSPASTYTDSGAPDNLPIENGSEILDGIENPVPVARIVMPNLEAMKTDPLIDHLLTTPTVVPPQKVSSPAPTPAKPAPAPKRAGPDPYHEPVN